MVIEKEPEIVPQISIHALNGIQSYQTMRVLGKVGKHELHILIDTGSTHNFLDTLKAKQIGCDLKNTYPLQVGVPGGRNLYSNTVCDEFSWKLQGEIFTSSVMLLPLAGCDMVLGMQ